MLSCKVCSSLHSAAYLIVHGPLSLVLVLVVVQVVSTRTSPDPARADGIAHSAVEAAKTCILIDVRY